MFNSKISGKLVTDLKEEQLSPRDFPRDKTLHELFELQVERTPNKIAVFFNNETIQ